MKHDSSKGFTIVELMVVLAIISILVVVALPAYVNYATHAKVSEGIGIASGAKTAVMSTYLVNDTFPITNTEAGLGLATDYGRQWVTGLSVGNIPSAGTITVELNLTELGLDNLLQLVPTANGRSFDWVCQTAPVNGVQGKFLPGSCR